MLPWDVVDCHSEEGEVLDAYGYTGEAPLVFRWAGRFFCGVVGFGGWGGRLRNLLQGPDFWLAMH